MRQWSLNRLDQAPRWVAGRTGSAGGTDNGGDPVHTAESQDLVGKVILPRRL